MDSNHRFLARKSRFLLWEANCGDRTGVAKKGCFLCGTDGSNPSPSRGKSANFWSLSINASRDHELYSQERGAKKVDSTELS